MAVLLPLRTLDVPMGSAGIVFPDSQKQSGSCVYDLLISLPKHEHDLLDEDDEFSSLFQVIGI